MKKCFFIFLILWIVCSCKSKQKFTADFRSEENRVEQSEAVVNEGERKDSVGQKIREVVSHREDDLETETVVKVTEYDVSKPVLETTGRPPVVRETETATKQRRGIREEIVEHLLESGKVDRVSERQAIVNAKREGQQELQEKVEQEKVRKSGSSLWNWLGFAGAIVILGYFYVRKWR